MIKLWMCLFKLYKMISHGYNDIASMGEFQQYEWKSLKEILIKMYKIL